MSLIDVIVICHYSVTFMTFENIFFFFLSKETDVEKNLKEATGN